MRRLPQGWQLVRLADVADTALGKMLDRGKSQGLPQVPYLRNVNVQWGRIDTTDIYTMELADHERDRFAVRDGDLLVCEGGEIGRAAIWRGGNEYLAYQKAIHRVRSKGDLHLPYLRYLLELYSNNGMLNRFSTGSTIAHLPQQRFRELPLPLPPLQEQLRIVGILEDHLSRLDKSGSLLLVSKQRLGRWVQSVVDGAFWNLPTADAVRNGSLNWANEIAHERKSSWLAQGLGKAYKEPTQPDVGVLRGAIPWSVVSMEAVTDPVRVIRYGILKPKVQTGGSVKYVEVKDLVGNSLQGKVLHLTSRELDEQFSGARLMSGDVVIAVRGSYERTAVVPVEVSGANMSRDVARLAPLPSCEPRFLHYWLQTSVSKAYLNHHARGVAVKGVNIATLRAMPIPVLPQEIQKEIVRLIDDRLSVATRTETEVGRVLAKSKLLRKALLTAAFSGRLTGRSSDVDVVEEMVGV